MIMLSVIMLSIVNQGVVILNGIIQSYAMIMLSVGILIVIILSNVIMLIVVMRVGYLPNLFLISF